MKKLTFYLPTGIACVFILLFCYASVSKLADFKMFQAELAQSPFFGDYSKLVSYSTIISEVLIVFLLCFHKSRLIGLFSSLVIMSAFTAYIYLILNYSDSIPCSCGGILEKMDWNEHFIFNLLCVMLAIIGIVCYESENKKKLISSIGLSVALPVIMLILIFIPHVNDNQGNFSRKIVNTLKSEHKIIELPISNYYFAGNHGDTLFLANRKTPLLLSSIIPDFNSVKVDKIKLDNYKYQFVSVTINVLYPYFSIWDGKVPVIFEGELPSLEAYDSGINQLYFSRFTMLAPQKYVFKTMLFKTKESELGILNTASKEYHIFPNVLNAQLDGVFDTDGNIAIDRNNEKIVYTHFYRDEIITTDFALGNIQRKRTIDSLSNMSIETIKLESGQTKLVKSPSAINRMQTVSGNKFYNVSRMRGKNESFKDFRKNDVIDVYEAMTKKYLYSFYIKNDKRIKIKDILSTKHYLYVLSDKNITRYTFK